MPSLAANLKASNLDLGTKTPHLVIEALAGTGKTTTLVEGLKTVFGLPTSITPSPQQAAVWESMALSKGTKSVAFVAFNKSIAAELQRRVPEGCVASTMHSMGLKACTAAFGRLTVNEYRVDDIIADIVAPGQDFRDFKRENFQLMILTKKMVGLCKMNLVGVDTESARGDWLDVEGLEAALDAIAGHYDIELNGNREKVYELVPKVLERCTDPLQDRKIDYDDMIWLPAVLSIPVPQFDLLLVDECQDLNRCQQTLAKKAGKRLIFCGDRHQAIYGFAGADSKSMTRLEEELGATPAGVKVLPLTVTRRCGRKIVEEAQRIVPAFEAHESNCEGSIKKAPFKGETVTDFATDVLEDGSTEERPIGNRSVAYTDLARPGDMLLCRVNAPLVSQCFRFLKEGRKANIIGRDVAQGLISTLKKVLKHYGAGWETAPVTELVEKLSDWVSAEEAKENRKKYPSESRLIMLQDRFDCLMCFTEQVRTAGEVAEKINLIFTDDRESHGILLSTIHKAKGLEADRVFLLEPTGASVPHPMAKTDWQIEQEWNLRYVAITRAIKELVYVK